MAISNTEQGAGRRTQSRIYLEGAIGRRPRVPIAPGRLEAAARRRLSRRAFGYLAGSAGTESTAKANREALDRVKIVPRRLVDVSRRELAVDLLGARLDAPLYLAPIGVLGMAHRQGDLAAARAATATGVPLMVSTQASHTMEDIAHVMGDHPRWFQLYWSSNDDLVASLLRRAELAGYRAVVVTLDTHVLGWRPRDLDVGFLPFAAGLGMAQYTSDPVFRALVANRVSHPSPKTGTRGRRPGPRALSTLWQLARSYPGTTVSNLRSALPRAAVQTFLDVFSRPSLSWADVGRLRELTSLPVVLKGVMHPDDARRAADEGVTALVVSNHGGRQIDGELAALDALPDVLGAVPELPVFFEGGVRGGADVLKALAMGAAAVGLGRPYVYGMAINGWRGARDVIANVVAELDLTMALSGRASVADLGPDLLRRI